MYRIGCILLTETWTSCVIAANVSMCCWNRDAPTASTSGATSVEVEDIQVASRYPSCAHPDSFAERARPLPLLCASVYTPLSLLGAGVAVGNARRCPC